MSEETMVDDKVVESLQEAKPGDRVYIFYAERNLYDENRKYLGLGGGVGRQKDYGHYAPKYPCRDAKVLQNRRGTVGKRFHFK